ncbi:hypothetical protein LTR36_005274 [Oleoguttula mirabilis]|uniref:Uncharacterized protein n=1 Tax=Oleoguttula mirabilis TaxID=1507867 RepID=A0AAV9JEL0_9PEZI|nr:hypothetical protein LTR36_005274 [Oleoguttula mirabilis]
MPTNLELNLRGKDNVRKEWLVDRFVNTREIHPELVYYRSPHEYGCCDDCPECTRQYRPLFEQQIDSRIYDDELEDAAAHDIASAFTAGIFQDLAYIREKLQCHGNTIMNRWTKKGVERRRILIKEAAPGLYEKKCAQVHLQYDHDDWPPKRAFRKTFLLPYLTVENLCDDKTKMLSLLHARASSEPQDWTMFDSEQFNDAFARGSLGLLFNPLCVVTRGDRYGQLDVWNKDGAHAWDMIGWPRGQLILEAQAELMHFLRCFVDQLLEGCNGESGSEKWQEVVTVGFKASGGQAFWAAHSRQAFTAAPSFNPRKLLEIAQTRLASAEDDLYLLQTDPAYAILQVTNLRKLKFYTLMGKESPDPWSPTAIEILQSHRRATMWRWVSNELAYVCSLDQKLSATDNVRAGADYNLAVGALHTLIKNIISQQVARLQIIIHALPGFQEIYEFGRNSNRQSTVRVKQIAGTETTLVDWFAKDPLFWAVHQLRCDDIRDIVDINKAFYFGFIDDLLANAQPKEKARLDQRALDYLSDMAGMDSILCAISYHRPHVMAVDQDTAVRTQGQREGGLSTWRNCTKEPPVKGFRQGNTPGAALKTFAEAGWPKGKRDESWLAEADRSRHLLNEFWTAMASHLRMLLDESGRSQEEIKFEMDLLQSGHAPQHLADLELEREAILASRADKQDRHSFALPEWAASSALPDKPVSLKDLANAHQKPKRRRGEGDDIAQDFSELHIGDGLQQLLSEEVQQAGSIEVNRDALRLFENMFSKSTETKGTVRWQQLVGAMVDAGCTVYCNGGSAVTFKHGTKSIVLHRPHPEPTIDPVILKADGERLKRRFGWDAEVFREREKGLA